MSRPTPSPSGDRADAGARHHADGIAPRRPSRGGPRPAPGADAARPATRSGSASPASRASASRPPSTRSAAMLTASGPQGRGARRRSRPRPAPAARSSATRPAWRGSPSTRTPSSAPPPPPARSAASRPKTRETMLLCEAAGFDVILVETVGVGQSETAVADLTDFFLVLMLPGRRRRTAGHQEGHPRTRRHDRRQQGRRRRRARAKAAAAEYRAALHILTPASATWTPPVVTVSGLTGQGLDDALAEGRSTTASRLEATRRTRGQAAGAGHEMDVGPRPRAPARAPRTDPQCAGACRRSRRRSPTARSRRPPAPTRS